MNFNTMGQMEVKPHNEKQKIYVFQGDLDDETVRKLPRIDGYILVTGNVIFNKSATIPGGLVVLGDATMQRVTIKGNAYLYGKSKAKRLIVHGELMTVARKTEVEKVIAAGHYYN